ncbi:TPA: hypothetical protein ACSTLU_004394 [Serratia fonticola]
MNIQQIRKAQNTLRWACQSAEDKRGIEFIVNAVNACWEEVGEPRPLPVGEYKRYSWLAADLTHMQMNMCEMLRDAELAAGYPVDEETGCDLREWSGNSINVAHAEALDMNEWFGYSEEQRTAQNERVVYGLNLMATMNQPTVLDACHAEALELNAMVANTKFT